MNIWAVNSIEQETVRQKRRNGDGNFVWLKVLSDEESLIVSRQTKVTTFLEGDESFVRQYIKLDIFVY